MNIKARSLDYIQSGWVCQYDQKWRVIQRFDDQEDPERFLPAIAAMDLIPGVVGSIELSTRIKAERKKREPK